jgi:uncharacterized lipoprotein YddW (UPF0748 family)
MITAETTLNTEELEAWQAAQEAAISALTIQMVDVLHRLHALENEQPTPPSGIPDNMRGLWIQVTDNDAIARARVQAAANVGSNAVFVFCGSGRGVTFANQAGIPNVGTLAVTIDEAKQHGIDVYAAIPSMWFWRSGYPAQNMNGKLGITENWLDFRNADARLLIAGLCYDVAQYDIAGVCLDYTRWSRHWYASAGLTAAPITATVRACQQALVGTGKMLTASPISIYDDSEWSALNYGQAWRDWLDQDLVDWLTPMVYSGQWHLEQRLAEWQTWGYWPSRAAAVLSPSQWKNHNEEIPKTDAEWRIELETVQAAGTRGIIVFDEEALGKHPSKARILRETW